jgi:hypothetical protein
MDFQKLIPNILAARAPVHPPVPGKGMPTKEVSPIASYFSIALPLRRVLAKIQFVKRAPMETLLIRPKNHSIKSSKIGIGTMFPTMDNAAASNQCILNTIIATGMEPRNSISGSIEIIKTISLGLNPFASNQFTVLSEKDEADNPPHKNSIIAKLIITL